MRGSKEGSTKKKSPFYRPAWSADTRCPCLPFLLRARVDTYVPDYSTVSPEFRTDIIKVKMDTVTIYDRNEIDYIRIY